MCVRKIVVSCMAIALTGGLSTCNQVSGEGGLVSQKQQLGKRIFF